VRNSESPFGVFAVEEPAQIGLQFQPCSQANRLKKAFQDFALSRVET
jgi:hypothetical protein